MGRKFYRKVLSAGKVIVFTLGLAVILASVLGVAGSALARSGQPFILGERNVSMELSKLVTKIKGPSVVIANLSEDSRATAMRLLVRPGHAPFQVNSDVKVRKLNADRLDGRHANGFLGANATAANSDKLDGRDSTDFAKTAILTARINGLDSSTQLKYGAASGISSAKGNISEVQTLSPNDQPTAKKLRVELTSVPDNSVEILLKAGQGTLLSCTVPAGSNGCSSGSQNTIIPGGSKLAIQVSRQVRTVVTCSSDGRPARGTLPTDYLLA